MVVTGSGSMQRPWGLGSPLSTPLGNPTTNTDPRPTPRNGGVALQTHAAPHRKVQVAMDRQGQQMLEGLDWELGTWVLVLHP